VRSTESIALNSVRPVPEVLVQSHDTGVAIVRHFANAVLATFALCGFISAPSHAQTVAPTEQISHMYPGEQIVEAAGFPALVKFEAGARGTPLVVFITGGGVLARVAYGHPAGKPTDFLSHWLKQEGIPLLALSYPMGNPVFARAYPDFSMTDWGEQSAEIIARHVKANDLPSHVVVLGWSMAGRIAEPITASLRKRGVEVELFVAMAAATGLPNLLPTLAHVKPQRSGLAGVAGAYTNALLLYLSQQNAEAGHTVIDPAIFPSQFMGDYPIRLAASALKFENGVFLPDPLGDQNGTGAWEYASFPPLALMTHEAPADARHALMDRSTWGFYISQTLSETRVFPRVKDFSKLLPAQWKTINDLVHGAPARLTMVMPGNHMFFVGEPGAKATVAALKELRSRAASLRKELDEVTRQ
jgi:hypothetical protein